MVVGLVRANVVGETVAILKTVTRWPVAVASHPKRAARIFVTIRPATEATTLGLCTGIYLDGYVRYAKRRAPTECIRRCRCSLDLYPMGRAGRPHVNPTTFRCGMK